MSDQPLVPPDPSDKVRIAVIGDSEFFATVAETAARLDRSLSWCLARCVSRALPEIAALDAGSEAVAAMKKSPLRHPLRLISLQANLALAESPDPDVADLATTPRGTEQRSLFFARDLYERFEAQADRLRLSSDEILMWAWERHASALESSTSNGS